MQWQSSQRGRWWNATITLVALGSAYPRVAACQGLAVALAPASQTVAPGSDFTLEITATQSSSPFNTLDFVIAYDPAALTYLPSSPLKLQEGCVMNGLCSLACGNTFHYVVAGSDSIWVVDGLLCADTFVSGPGQLYKLRFHASSTPQVTRVNFRSFRAYDAGLTVAPVTTTDATLGIGVTLDAGPPAVPARGVSLRATPNPARDAVTLSLSVDRAGRQQIDVYDVCGRIVRAFPAAWQPAGARLVAWDGSDSAGERVPPGLYLVTLRTGERCAASRVVITE